MATLDVPRSDTGGILLGTGTTTSADSSLECTYFKAEDIQLPLKRVQQRKC